MRVIVLLGLLLVFGTHARESAGQSGEVHCPAPGTRLTFSLGGRIEAVSDQGNYVCRFKILNTQKTLDLLFGAFAPTAPTVQANAEKLRSLVPFRVGRKTTFENSGASVRGTDGFWFHDVSIERFETVTTAAGTFSAFVILWNEQTSGAFGRWQSRYWYSPDVNYTVKFEYAAIRGNPPPNYPKNWELTAYTPPGGQPGGAGPQSAAVRPAPVVQAPPAPPAPVPEPPAIKPAPTVVAATPSAVAVPVARDGTWRMDMRVITSNGNSVGGECQPHPSIPLIFVNGNAEGPSTKLRLTSDDGISGWMLAPSMGSSAVPFVVNVSGRSVDGVYSGLVSGRCTGSFVMTRQ